MTSDLNTGFCSEMSVNTLERVPVILTSPGPAFAGEEKKVRKKKRSKNGHRVKIHNITSATGKERGDLEIKDYVVIQNLNLKLPVSLLLAL